MQNIFSILEILESEEFKKLSVDFQFGIPSEIRSTKEKLLCWVCGHVYFSSTAVKLIELLLQNKTDSNTRNNKGETPLLCLCACFKKSDREQRERICEAIQLLIDNGADVLCENKGRFPIRHAIVGKHEQLCELLLKNYADINQKGKNGETGLITLLKNRSLDSEFLEFLIDKGVSLSVVDKDGLTPVEIIKSRATYIGGKITSNRENLIKLINRKIQEQKTLNQIYQAENGSFSV